MAGVEEKKCDLSAVSCRTLPPCGSLFSHRTRVRLSQERSNSRNERGQAVLFHLIDKTVEAA